MNLDFLKDKKIAILGLGTEGRSALQFLIAHGISPRAAHDLSSEVSPDTESLLDENNVVFISGQDYLDNLEQYDYLFRSPGVPRLSAELVAFPRQENILSVTKLFFQICPCPIIGVTGTKGKGTTSSLIQSILKAAGKDVYLGGNIGEPPLDFYSKLDSESLVVLELSSFQLQDLSVSPHIAVVLNITQDHLDHHRSVEEYRDAKLSIIKHQKPDDFAVVSDLLPDPISLVGLGKKIIFHQKDGDGYKTKLLGAHNKYNIAAAVKTVEILEIRPDIVREAVAEFEGLKHRLQVVSKRGGITFVNDSFSTNIDTTVAAIDSFQSPLVLILGGSDKGLDYVELGRKIVSSSHIKGIVLVGQVADKVEGVLSGYSGTVLKGASTMSEIITQALSISTQGDTVLLSPASASFGMFKNYKDRGDQFIKAVS